MDLEAFHHKHLAEVFLEEYKKHFAAAFQTREDYILFDYFKSLRANVRAKVHVMSAMQAENPQELSFHTGEARKYLVLMNEYIARQRSLSQVMQ